MGILVSFNIYTVLKYENNICAKINNLKLSGRKKGDIKS